MPPRPSTDPVPPAQPVQPEQVPASRNTPSTVGDDDTADCIVVKVSAKPAMYPKRTRKPTQKAAEAEAAAAAAATSPVPISDSDSDAGRTRARRAAAATSSRTTPAATSNSSRTTPGNKRALNQAEFPPTQPPAAKRLTTTAFEPTRDRPAPVSPHPAADITTATTTVSSGSSSLTPLNSPGYRGQNTLARFEAIKEDDPRPPQQATAEVETYQHQLKEAANKNEELTELLKFTREQNAALTKGKDDLSTRLEQAQAKLNDAQQDMATITQAGREFTAQASYLDQLMGKYHVLEAEKNQLVDEVTRLKIPIDRLDLDPKDNIAHIRGERDGAIWDGARSNNMLCQAKDKIDKLEDDITKLHGQITTMQDQNKKLQDHNTTLQRDNTTLQDHNTKLQEQTAALQDHNTKLQGQNASLYTQNIALRAQLKQEQQDFAEQIRQLEDKYRKEYDELEAFATRCIDKMMASAQKIRDGVPPDEEIEVIED